jgi:CheY-like chemotaxis protein
MHVLVVDDEIPIVSLLADVLGDEGYDVAKAFDGEAALAMLRAGLRPAVVIMDVMMPKLDGMALYDTLRTEFADDDIGILMISAGKQIRLDDPRALFLPKPFSIVDLLTAIERLAPS